MRFAAAHASLPVAALIATFSVNAPTCAANPVTRIRYVAPAVAGIATRDPKPGEHAASSLQPSIVPAWPGHPLCTEITVSNTVPHVSTTSVPEEGAVKAYHTSG